MTAQQIQQLKEEATKIVDEVAGVNSMSQKDYEETVDIFLKNLVEAESVQFN